MTGLESEFERRFGRACPAQIVQLIERRQLSTHCPVKMRFQSVPWILEIDHALDQNDQRFFDVESQRLMFAVSSDGHPLLIDLSSDRLRILQDEFGDVDDLGVVVGDLLSAKLEKYD